MALFARATSIFIITNRNYSKTISSGRKSVTWKNFPSQFTFCGHCILRQCSTNPDITKDSVNFITFDKFLQNRRSEARRSILVEVKSENSLPHLHYYCSGIGKIESMYFYTLSNKSRFVLVEFEEKQSADAALESATHTKYNEIIPTQSSLLIFRRTRNYLKASQPEEIPLKYHKEFVLDSDLLRNLSTSKSIVQQMQACYNLLKLDEFGARLRFYTSYQVERCFTGMFPLIQVLPFGSTVNGFGKINCDLDLYLNLDKNRKEDTASRLVFQTKRFGRVKNSTDLLRIIGDLLDTVSPGVVNVEKILRARVPIIKFNNNFTGIQCDLSLSNMSAVHMSELLYLFGEIDSRVRPIVFTVTKWAKNTGLISQTSCLKTFPLTLLILFYLQQKKIIPTLQELKSKALKEDVRITDSNVDCTFARDMSKFKMDTVSDLDSFTLLKGFFEYYAVFNYKAQGLCLLRGSLTRKVDNSAIFIHNPLDPTLNVSKNVSYKDLDKIRFSCRDAFWCLENAPTSPSEPNWGILTILVNNAERKTALKKNINTRGTVNVKEYLNDKSHDAKLHILSTNL